MEVIDSLRQISYCKFKFNYFLNHAVDGDIADDSKICDEYLSTVDMVGDI